CEKRRSPGVIRDRQVLRLGISVAIGSPDPWVTAPTLPQKPLKRRIATGARRLVGGDRGRSPGRHPPHPPPNVRRHSRGLTRWTFLKCSRSDTGVWKPARSEIFSTGSEVVSSNSRARRRRSFTSHSTR